MLLSGFVLLIMLKTITYNKNNKTMKKSTLIKLLLFKVLEQIMIAQDIMIIVQVTNITINQIF